jgi:hypothetical protein
MSSRTEWPSPIRELTLWTPLVEGRLLEGYAARHRIKPGSPDGLECWDAKRPLDIDPNLERIHHKFA